MSITIQTTLDWSSAMEKAPKGEYVTTITKVMVKGVVQDRERTDHVATKILALTKCGKVITTYWIPEKLTSTGFLLDGDRWSGFTRGVLPLLWAPWPDADVLMGAVPKHEEIAA